MIPISQRLRAYSEPVGDGKGTWRKVGLCQEAADIMDEVVEVLALARVDVVNWYRTFSYSDAEQYPAVQRIDAALAKAKGKQE
ncbi:MAG: hypothetical protein M9939_00770 [Mesorhizobium sp.]|nr:hypothetical protein [Mesorhizobium sp.]MCO5159640.1 hypothetical protein [Mesorhizobium sp.]